MPEIERWHAFSWTEEGGMIDITPPGWTDAMAFGINNDGWIVGEGIVPDGTHTGFFLYLNPQPSHCFPSVAPCFCMEDESNTSPSARVDKEDSDRKEKSVRELSEAVSLCASDNPVLLTISDVAAVLRVSSRQLRRLLSAGKFYPADVCFGGLRGRKWRSDRLAEWIKCNCPPADAWKLSSRMP